MIKIATRKDRIVKKIQKLQDELAVLRSICGHPKASKTYKSNTGNYDPTADRYWIEFKCPDCDKFWTENQ